MGNKGICCGNEADNVQVRDIASQIYSTDKEFRINDPNDIGKFIKTPPKSQKKRNNTQKDNHPNYVSNTEKTPANSEKQQSDYLNKTATNHIPSIKNNGEENSTSQDTEPSTTPFSFNQNPEQQIMQFQVSLLKNIKFEDFDQLGEWVNFDKKVDYTIYEKKNYDNTSNDHSVCVRGQEHDGDDETDFWSIYQNFETSLTPEEHFYLTRMVETFKFTGQLMYESCRFHEVLFSTEIEETLYFWIKINVEKDINKRLVEEEIFILSAFKKINNNTFREYFHSFKPNPNEFPTHTNGDGPSRVIIFKGMVEYKKINDQTYNVKQYCHIKPTSTTGIKLQKLSLKKYYQSWFENAIVNGQEIQYKGNNINKKIDHEFQKQESAEIKQKTLSQVICLLH